MTQLTAATKQNFTCITNIKDIYIRFYLRFFEFRTRLAHKSELVQVNTYTYTH